MPINVYLILSAIVTFTIYLMYIAAAIHVLASDIPISLHLTVISLFAPLLPQAIPALDGF